MTPSCPTRRSPDRLHGQESIGRAGRSATRACFAFARKADARSLVHSGGNVDRKPLFLVHPAFAPASTTGLLNHLPRAMTGRARPLDNEKSLLRPHLAVTVAGLARSEEHTSELQSLMRLSYAVFCLTTQ